ncbi:orotate phosphoribosyltransferase [Oceanivirga miroungae]|uniref:Orotate phosphoribosyltransferase n=1 Tax=Oceanivirga miroungae TaxID=1130046 RepID=A0A6I8M6J0_9FUSO|nr:orotate phosphoribosyltransferase [Oceanivirga miroungae]VWL85512.1 Orotate phosphoribosyltransferase [Oceanivirga miroungae]
MSNDEKIVLDILKESNAILEGHFLLSSKRHSNRYIQCAKLTTDPNKTKIVADILAKKLKDLKIDKLVGPAMGGIIISYELARSLNVKAMFTERVDNKMTLRRGFSVEKGEKILIVEDVVTTAKSSLETISVLENLGADIVGIASIIDRRTEIKNIGYNIYSALKLNVENYDELDCELCKNKVEIYKPGSRKI